MRRIRHGIRNLIIAIFALIIVSALFYHSAEGWSWLDSIFFTILTITTVGHNNVAALSPASKVYTSLIAFIGIAMVLTLFGIISSHYVRIVHDEKYH